MPVGATHTYTVPPAGSTGFEAGWGTCVQNVSASGNATISTSTSVFNGAGGGTSFLLEAGGWACLTSKGGNWYTQVGHYNQPLSNTGVTAGSYTCMNGTVTADGRLTAAANGSCGGGGGGSSYAPMVFSTGSLH